MAYRVFRFARNKYKTKNLGVLNSVMFIGEPGGCNRSRVSNRSRGLLLEEIWYIDLWCTLQGAAQYILWWVWV